MADFKPLEWRDNKLILLDQTRLPAEEVYLEIRDYRELVAAIKCLAVRGAPAIGIAAAYGVALGALQIQTADVAAFRRELKTIIREIEASRPTARNLFWATERMARRASAGNSVTAIRADLIQEALAIHREQMEADLALARLGATLFNDGDRILTHCNTGALATGGYGTALGVIKMAHAGGKKITVVATETRPLLQGARLTACELQKAAIPFTLSTDSMAGSFMRRKLISAVITGADRIARNGDTANKIGTYSLAVLARVHGLPFYIAAPTSTVDLGLATGDEIPIEQRAPSEVTGFQGQCSAPPGITAANPAFDVTPHEFITAIITEKAIVRPPFENNWGGT